MKKERFAWIPSWCDETFNTDLPRVLLIGDSITHGYQDIVRKMLAGKAYVDYLATSYSVDMKIYRSLTKSFVKDSDYAVIHFNNGLHGDHLSARSYQAYMKKVLADFTLSEVILATSTLVNEKGNGKADAFWRKRLKERNRVVKELCEENGFACDDLFEVSSAIPKECRTDDGFHYSENGYRILADSVVRSIVKKLS